MGQEETTVHTSKLFAVDGLATSAVSLGEVATLEHEVGDHTVEARSSIAFFGLPLCELAEVAGGLGDDIVVELEDNSASGLVVDGDIKLLSRKNR